MTFGVNQERFFAAKRGLDRTLQQPCGKRGLTLVRHVFFAAERATIADEFGDDAISVHRQDAGNIVTVVPDALTAGVDHEPIEVDGLARGITIGERQRFAGRHRDCQGRFGLQECVVNTLRLERLTHHMGRSGQTVLGVAPGVGRCRQHIAIEFPHRVFGGSNRLDRIHDRRVHVVLNLDERGRVASGVAILGHNHGDHVAQITGAAADRDEDRPVLMDETMAQFTRHIGTGEDPHHTWHSFGSSGVDGDDVGSGMVGQLERAVCEIDRNHVVDKRTVTKRQRMRFVFDPATTDTTGLHRNGHFVGCQRLDRVENLGVARATAQVAAHEPGCLVTGQAGTTCRGLVEHRLGTHENPRRAKTTLQRTKCSEGIGHTLPLIGLDAFERDNGCAFGLVE